MKVKELIELLSGLDQEKEIKAISACGYEYEEETSDFKVVQYKETLQSIIDRNGVERKISGVTNWEDNEEFYIINPK
jgi:hypothetical protein